MRLPAITPFLVREVHKGTTPPNKERKSNKKKYAASTAKTVNPVNSDVEDLLIMHFRISSE